MTLSLRVVLGLLALLIARTSAAEIDERSMRVAGTTVRYKLVLPDGYDPAEEYPAVLVFGGGPQTMRTVEGTLERNFRAEAERRGYLVFAPAAPNDELFFQRGDRIFPEFLDKLLAEHKIVGGRAARSAIARFTLEQGQGHRLETLAGENAARLFDGFDEAQRGCISR